MMLRRTARATWLSRFLGQRPEPAAAHASPEPPPPPIFPARGPDPRHAAPGPADDQFRGARVVTGIGTLVLVELPDPAATGRHEYRVLEQPGGPPLHGIEQLSVAALSRTGAALRDALAEAHAGRPDALRALRDGFGGIERSLALDLMRRILSADAQPPLLLAVPPLAGDDRDLPRLQVRTDPGGLSLVLDGAVEFPLLLGDTVFPHFEPGWQVSSLITRLLPFLLIELRHETGQRATWVLDEHLVHRENDAFRNNVAPLWDRIRAVVPPLMRREWERVCAQDFATAADPIFRLNPRALRAIFQNTTTDVCPAVESLQLADMPPTRILPPTAIRRDAVTLRRQHVERALHQELFSAGVDAIRTGRLTWPSPVDGSGAELEAIYPIQEYTVLYQFRDRNGLRFIVATGDRNCVLIGLLIPDSNLLLGDAYVPDQWFRGLVVGTVWHNLLDHVFRHHDLVEHGVRRPDSPIRNVFMGRPWLHIGHYIWNDLPGQLALVERLGDAVPPSVVFEDADNASELFGPLEQLFPRLAGRVHRDHVDKEAFIRGTIADGTVPIRFTRDYVPAALRQAVRDRTMRTTTARDIARHVRDDLRDRLIVVVGIRLENRTLDDNDDFFGAMLEHLARHHPGAVLVFDGRNSRAGGRSGEMIGSITDGVQIVPAGDAELALVARLRQRFAGSGLLLESTIGLPTEASLAWCYAARCCVALWGAGMAKYRWLANLPTLCLSSHFNLTQRHDYDIYHSARYMEQPAPMLHLRPEQVTDLPGRAGLMSQPVHPGNEIFTVQQDAAFALLDRLLRLPRWQQTGTPAPPPDQDPVRERPVRSGAA